MSNKVLAGIVSFFCGCWLFAGTAVAGYFGGGEIPLQQFGQLHVYDGNTFLPETKEPSSVFPMQYQWFTTLLPAECTDEICSLRFTEPLLRGVECAGQKPCRITNSDPYHLTFANIEPGTVLHLYPSPDNPEAIHQYIVFNRETLQSTPQTNRVYLGKPPFVFENGETQWQPDQLIPVVPVIYCNNNILSLLYYPFRKMEQTLAALIIRLLVLPVNKPPQMVLHFEQCYRGKSELREFMASYGHWQSLTDSLTSDYNREVSGEKNSRPQGVMAYREASDPDTNEKIILVWRNNQWQKADDEALRWVRGLKHIEDLDRLFGIDTSGPYGYGTPHNQRLRAVIDRIYEEQNQQTSKKKVNLLQKATVRKAADRPPGSGNVEEVNDDHSDDEEVNESAVLHSGNNAGSSSDTGSTDQAPGQSEQHPTSQADTDANDADNHPQITPLRDITAQAGFLDVANHAGVTISREKIHRDSQASGNYCALLSPVIRSGIHRWKLNVQSDLGSSICIGVARHGFQLDDAYKNDPLRHIYHHRGLHLWRSYKGELHQNGNKLARKLEPFGWQENTVVVVECEVNVANRTLEIFKNDCSLGVAFGELEFPLQACVCLYASYKKVITFEQYLCSEPDTALPSDIPQATACSIDYSEHVHFAPDRGWGTYLRTNKDKTLERSRDTSGNVLCGLSYEMIAPGIYDFSVIVENDLGASTCVGVAKPAALNSSSKPASGNVYVCKSTYLYRTFQGMLYADGQVIEGIKLDEAFVGNSLIAVRVVIDPNSHKAKMTFTINGKKQPECSEFNKLSAPLVPVVGFYAGMVKKLTLIHFSFTPALVSASNNLDTEAPNAIPGLYPSVFIRRNELTPDTIALNCIDCGGPVNTIALPCKHSLYCAQHLIMDGTTTCIICGAKITGSWNLLFDTEPASK